MLTCSLTASQTQTLTSWWTRPQQPSIRLPQSVPASSNVRIKKNSRFKASPAYTPGANGCNLFLWSFATGACPDHSSSFISSKLQNHEILYGFQQQLVEAVIKFEVPFFCNLIMLITWKWMLLSNIFKFESTTCSLQWKGTKGMVSTDRLHCSSRIESKWDWFHLEP